MKKTALILLALLPALAHAEETGPTRQHFIDQVAECAAWFGLNGLIGGAEPPAGGPREATALNLALGRLLDGDLDRVAERYNVALDHIITEATRVPGNDEQRLQGLTGRYNPGCHAVYRSLDDDMAKWIQ